MSITSAVLGAVIYFSAAAIALAVEKRLSAERRAAHSTRLNYSVTAFNMAFNALIAPLTGILTVMVVNAAGGGWIEIPSSGWGLVAGIVAYTLAMDGLEYAFHRAQHRFPVMWAMHSLHHSDTALCSASTGRHHWAEYGIKVLTIYLLVGIIFKANTTVLLVYGVITFYNLFPHMNIRVGFGRASFLMNAPQFHRIHHSSLPQHYNCNYAGLFPVFDVIFGTYRQPRPGEYPPTGIEHGHEPANLVDVLLWPRPRRSSRATDGVDQVATKT